MASDEGTERDSRFLRLRRALLVACCLVTPLVAAPGVLQDPFNLPKLILISLVTIAAAALALTEWLLRGRPITGGSLVLPACATTMPLIAAWFVSPYKEWALLGSYTRFLGVAPYVVFALFGLLLFDAFRGNASSLAWAISISAALVGLYSFGQVLGLDPVTWRTEDGREIFRQTSTIGNTNFLGGFLAIALPVSLALWRSAGRTRLLAMASTVFITEGLLFSTSQGAWVAAIAGVGWTVGGLSGRAWPRRAGVVIAGVAAGALLTIPMIAAAKPTSVVGGVSIIARGHLWAGAGQMALERPLFGWGPNSFAVEGARYRDTSDVVAFGETRPDDPHSVPAAFLANAGFAGLALWGVGIASLVFLAYRGAHHASASTVGFAGGVVAYVTQALVTIDVVTLRFALWTCAAGLASSMTHECRKLRRIPHARAFAQVTAVCIVVLAISSASWLTQAVRYDAVVASAIEAFNRHDIEDGIAGFEDALGFRDEYGYRQLYSTRLAFAALEAGRGGKHLIERMEQVNSYLGSFPDPGHILARAQLLHYWGHYDPTGDVRAVSGFRRALQLDPANYLIRMPLSEALIDLGRTEEALAVLSPAMDLVDLAPRLWASYAIAALEAGDIEDARAAVRSAKRWDPNGCRTHISEALLVTKIERDRVPQPLEAQIFFACEAGLFQFFLDRVSHASSLT